LPGEVIGQVENIKSGMMGDEEVVRYFRTDGSTTMKSGIPGWKFEGSFPSIGHCLVVVARSHRQFIEPNAAKRLCRETAQWPLWGRLVAVLFLLGALAEILGFLWST